jgi:hypothetical protein
MPWMARFSGKMAGVLALMVLVEFAAYLMYREMGVNRLLWIPVSFGLVAFAGFDTVRRLPLVWGAFVGGLLAALTNLLSWPIGAFVAEGQFRWPDEAEPMLVATSVLIAAVFGVITGFVAGNAARARRRQRQRRSALGKLAYSAFDEPFDDVEVRDTSPIAMPMAERAERR